MLPNGEIDNEDGEMTVSKQVDVNLSIGQYNDKVLCDVVPMEATHSFRRATTN